MTQQADPFGTAAIVERVLAGWAAAPERFREDANAEEDLARGGYRDRVMVELAQNAADAAARAGVPGRLLLRLTDDVLVAANTGAPLDAAGVSALATLRASAKRPGATAASVGRFGVGFAAVLAVSDEPMVLSRGGGARFSRADTARLVAEVAASHPDLGAEVERREGHVPVLRLPFPAEGEPPRGYDTAVLLPLRDGAAHDLAVRLLDEVDDALLIALPGLAEVLVERAGTPPRRLADVDGRWHRLTRTGTHHSAALADRPTEERQRPAWSVTWAVPVDGATTELAAARVVHAPTPTDEPLDWPALLVATFPLDPTRRHVAEGPAATAIVTAAAQAYADFLTELAAFGRSTLSLVPVGLPAGGLDAQLREVTLPLLADSPVLQAIEDAAPLRPRDAVALERGPWADEASALAALAPVLAGLVAAPRQFDAALELLGVRRLSLADFVEQLPEQPDTEAWLRLLAGLAPLAADPVAREALSTMPVPLRDGRTVRGVRGLLLVDRDVRDVAVDLLVSAGARVVAPELAADAGAAALLERLGATGAGPAELLTSPELARAVAYDEGAPDGWTPEDLWEAVLPLVAQAVDADALPADRLPWAGEMLLPDTDHDLVPAELLVQPGSAAESLLDPESVGVLARELFARWPASVWSAVGVVGDLRAVAFADVDTTDLPDELAEQDGADEWARLVGTGTVGELAVVLDLDLVHRDRWQHALAVVATEPNLRRALLDPVRLRDPSGTVRTVQGYTSWWLRRELDLGGHAAPDADPLLAAVLPPAPPWAAALVHDVSRALGLVREWADLDAAAWQKVLGADFEKPPGVASLLSMWKALAQAGTRLDDPPDRLWAVSRNGVVLADADDACVIDAPMWWQRQDITPALVVPQVLAAALADVLDLDLASETAPGEVASGGRPADVPAAVRAVLPDAAAQWVEHDVLRVDGVEVEWWVEGAGQKATLHASTPSGLARALAQAAGRWDLRLVLERVLSEPDGVAGLLVEDCLG